MRSVFTVLSASKLATSCARPDHQRSLRGFGQSISKSPMWRRHLSMVFVLALGGLGLGMPAAQAAEGTLRGTVIEAGTGSRLGGVTVQAFCWEVVGADPGQACGATQTANDGTYSMTLAAGNYKVSFDHWPEHRAEFYGGWCDCDGRQLVAGRCSERRIRHRDRCGTLGEVFAALAEA